MAKPSKICLVLAAAAFFLPQALLRAQCSRKTDSLELVKLYNATGGKNWRAIDTIVNGVRQISPWNLSAPLERWYGVGLSASGCVECIDLDGDGPLCYAWSENPPGTGLKGAFPVSVCRLAGLKYLSLRGNKGLAGPLPDSIQYLKLLEKLLLNDCSLTGPLPEGMRFLTNLTDLTLDDNPLNAPLPAFLGDLKKLQALSVQNAGLYGSVPPEAGQIDSLKRLHIGGNRLSGALPASFSARKFNEFLVWGNQLDSLPNINLYDYGFFYASPGYEVGQNRLTFDDVLPLLDFNAPNLFSNYTPQDSVFKDTTVQAAAGCGLNVSLKIDGAITDNSYRWFKNGARAYTGKINQLILNNIQTADAGVYTCEITNPRAPLLTLYSRKITVRVSAPAHTSAYKTICPGDSVKVCDHTYRSAGVFEDTVKSQAGCDSTITTTVAVFKADTAFLTKTSCLPSDTGTVKTLLKNRNGCDSLVITRTALAAKKSSAITAVVCAGDSARLFGRWYKTAGVYKDSVFVIGGCDSVVTLVLTVAPKISASIFQRLCLGDSLKVGRHIYRSAGSYLDTLKNQAGCDSVISTKITVFKPDTIVLNKTSSEPSDTGLAKKVYKNLQGCDSLVITRTVFSGRDAAVVRVFNGLTPDGPDNRFFEIENIGRLGENELTIYNRWGEVVFRAKNYNNDWSGLGLNNAPLPEGAYYYNFMYNNQASQKTGPVLIWRQK